MRRSLIFALALISCPLPLAFGQGVTRICQQNISALTGNTSCVDVAPQAPFPVTAPSFAPGQSTAAEACRQLKSSGGIFYSLGASNVSGAAGWILLFDSAAIPANGAALPAEFQQIAAAASIIFAQPFAFLNGLSVCISSTGPFTLTKVTSGGAFYWQVQ